MTRQVMVFGTYKVRLFQRNDQPSNYWFMRTHVEGRPYKRSLKTAVLETARERAQTEMIEVLAKLKAGQKVFPTSVHEARTAYLLDQQAKVARDKRSKFTIKKVNQRTTRAMDFLKSKEIPPTASIDSVQGTLWQGFIDWRLETQPDIRRDGIHADLVAIRAFFEWCQGKGWCSQSNIPQWELDLEKQQATRDKIPADKMIEAWKLMGSWVGESPDGSRSVAKNKRYMVYTVFYTMMHGAFRPGEILQVKYKDIQVSEKELIVTVRDTTSKVRKTRQVPLIGDAGIYLFYWLKLRNDWQPDEMIFLFPNESQPSRLYYKEFGQFRKDVLIPNGLGNLDSYHCRHYCITNWLMIGHSIHLVAKLCGTSVSQIEKTYSGIIDLVIGREFAKKKLLHKPDGSFEVATDVAPKFNR